MENPLLEMSGVSKHFDKRLDLAERLARALGTKVEESSVRAVDRVDLTIARGEVVGLVGESGCGKSTLGRIAAQVYEPSSGTLRWKGDDIAGMTRMQKRLTNLSIQMIAQDPASSLNPRMRVCDIVGEAPLAHGLVHKSEKQAYIADLMRMVGLDPMAAKRYPHQFSGGQRQRISIARALAVKPELIVCDEAVAALDVSIAAQVLNLFADLKENLDLTYIFISHDLGVVEHISDYVVIMYLGKIIEKAKTADLFANPHHPYTKALLAEIPRLDRRKRRFSAIKGELPSPLRPPDGCHFHPRCPHVMEMCRRQTPEIRLVDTGHFSACHLSS